MAALRRVDLIWLVPLSVLAAPFKAVVVAFSELVVEIGALFVVSAKVWKENRR